MNNDIAEAIADVVGLICMNPLVHVSETDIHALFIHRLFEIKGLSPFRKVNRLDTACTIGLNRSGVVSQNKYSTMLVHKEYGHNDKAWARSDVVIFNPGDVPAITDPINLKTQAKRYLTPDYVFEFGTEKSGSSIKTLKKHLKQDLEKTGIANKRGYVINIHRNFTSSIRGKKLLDLNRDKIVGLQHVIKKIWKDSSERKSVRVALITLFI